MPTTRKRSGSSVTPPGHHSVDHWMTVPQAAEALGVSRYMVHKLKGRGQLEIEVMAGRDVVSRISVQRYLEARSAATNHTNGSDTAAEEG